MLTVSATQKKPTILLTPGEPAGIGPELCLQLCQQEFDADIIVYADQDMIRDRARMLDININITDTAGLNNSLRVEHVPMAVQVVPGKPSPDNAEYVLETLRLAVKQCRSQQAQALVTGPVDKSIINEAGISFSGHTEYLGQLSGSPQTLMMLACDTMRVALATTHLPLSRVSESLSINLLEHIFVILNRDLQRFYQLDQPRILVCGLNPHAGEQGYLGNEEQEIIIPAIKRARRQNILLTGPVPADTAFTPKALENSDVILTMYHDQGLPVIKHTAFRDAVNITLGLPYPRVSVDHGTAYDLAGTGSADPSSMRNAIQIAADFARRLS